ncbi:ABC-2 type transport system ATP-binding protein [Branchiibius hedensis]|uniref:X-Pro dipeptidyl-peptidase (S15 family) n=1 Tax=Branchiibius hedensis TaxID=672460 RepID=A0A2Y8ZVA2_9MICO|nr:CocE/NonD family hydrolase [Branchiibius hedensis]PWJ27173.1 ABC-2 type transport system ATP-binding protein [Branchiibius hedensis]SSA35984.1 X-Pro dipeptidyl-peptidase (S15 family) [Branchiibius hedensis]
MTPATSRMRNRSLAAICAVGIAGGGFLGTATIAKAAPAAVPSGPIAFSIKSFDGTTITGNYFRSPASDGRRAPTVLEGPGWGGAALTDPTAGTSTSGGTIGVAPLLANGYNVVSWNPRGFRTSTGQAQADSLLYEGRDVSAILNWVAHQPWAQLDRPGDPAVGMVGGSYGGGVQWAAAALDRRIDAIAPDISWNSLTTSLYPNRTAKSGWATSLYLTAVGAGQRNNPVIDTTFQQAASSVTISQQGINFLGSWQRTNLAAWVHAPALILQGTVDTLFPLDEAAANYAAVSRNRVPVKMVWFCGGHGVCLTNPGDTSVIERDTLAWLNRYVKRQRVSTGAGFEWVDQNGVWHSAASYRPNKVSHRGVSAGGSGTLSLVPTGGSGPYTGPGASQLGPIASLIATKAPNAVNVPIQFNRATKVLGAPRLSVTYSGTAPGSTNRVLAQIVDNSTGVVLGSQLTPFPVTLDGRTHRVSVPMEYIAASATAGQSFTLQLVANSSQINVRPSGGSVTFSKVSVTLPVAGH